MDVSQYLEIFLDESKEHLENLNKQILILEQEPENMNTVNEIFRAAHSLKGMAGTMGYKRMQNLTHDMENVFSEVRNNTIKVNAGIIDVIFKCIDALDEYVSNIQENADEGTNENEDIIKALNDILNGNSASADAPKEEAKEESKAEEPAAEEKGDAASDDKAKWKSIEINQTLETVIAQAYAAGSKVYGFTIYIQETCVLKAARAFLVYKALEELGEVIVSVPPVQDIEDEKFGFDFSLMIISEKSVDDVKKAIMSVSEIADAVGAQVTLDESTLNKYKEEEKEAPTGVAVASKSAPSTTTSEKQGEKKATTTAAKPVVNRTVRVDIEKLDVLMNLVSELIIAKNSLVSAAQTTNQSAAQQGSSNFNEQIEYLESVTTNLHESVMKVRMVPIESVVSRFPRMIRDLSKKLDKKMELYMSGEETELDRTVVDEIGDPLMHLLRNSADHGIESAEDRRARGKSEVGSIFLEAYQDGNNVVIEVRDDGNGIDVDKVRRKAIERGTITEEQAATMEDKEIINLLFLPSFSTAEKVSDVSGRGVGLDVVKSKIEALSGEVEVKSKLGEGSTFIIRLPLTLAIIQALMVSVGGEKYAVSLGSIQTIEDITPQDVVTVQSKEVIHLRGSVIPIIRMNEVLDIESTKGPDDNLTVIIVKKGDRLAGLVVDELIGQQEIVIKSLGKYINKTKIISGATILGDGEIALIIDTNALL